MCTRKPPYLVPGENSTSEFSELQSFNSTELKDLPHLNIKFKKPALGVELDPVKRFFNTGEPHYLIPEEYSTCEFTLLHPCDSTEWQESPHFNRIFIKPNLTDSNVIEDFFRTGRKHFLAQTGSSTCEFTFLDPYNSDEGEDPSYLNRIFVDPYLTELNCIESSLGESDLVESFLEDSNLVEGSLGESDFIDGSILESDLVESFISESNIVDSSLLDSDLIEESLVLTDLTEGSINCRPSLTEITLGESDLIPRGFLEESDIAENFHSESRLKNNFIYERLPKMNITLCPAFSPHSTRTNVLPNHGLNSSFIFPPGIFSRTFMSPFDDLSRTLTSSQNYSSTTYTPSRCLLNRTCIPSEYPLDWSSLFQTSLPKCDSISNEIIMPIEFEYGDQSETKTFFYNSPSRRYPLKVDIGIFLHPFVQTEIGEQFKCDIFLKMEESLPQNI